MTPAQDSLSNSSVDTRQVVSGARWLASGQIATQAARLVVNVVLARLLAPQDFGLLTMANAFVALAWLLLTLGTSDVIVQRRALSEGLLRTLTTMAAGMGLALTALLAGAAWPIAHFYGEPRVTWIVLALATTFAITGWGVVPEGLLQRDLRFGRLVAIDALQLVTSSGLSVTLALFGWGVWALVVGNLVGTVARSAGLVASSPWRLRVGFDPKIARGLSRFSSSIVGFNVVHYAARNTDRLLIGRLLGAVNLGYYDYAFRFYMYPLEVITVVVMRVMFPTFARMQHDPQQLGRAFLRTNGAIALLVFPMMTGLAVLADPFVRVVLGEKWAPIIPLVQILAPVAMLQALGATPTQLLLASGRVGLRFWWSVVYTSVIISAVLFGMRWGIVGVAASYATVMVPIIVAGFWLALRLVDRGLGAIWGTLGPIFAAAAVMGSAVAVIRRFLEPTAVARGILLLFAVASGIVVYAMLVRRLAPQAVADLYRLLPARARTQAFVRWVFAAGPEVPLAMEEVAAPVSPAEPPAT